MYLDLLLYRTEPPKNSNGGGRVGSKIRGGSSKYKGGIRETLPQLVAVVRFLVTEVVAVPITSEREPQCTDWKH